MRDYEVVFLVDPDQSDQVPAMISRYQELIEKQQGKIHRLEDWGRQQMAYAIAQKHKAHYVLMNIEVGQETLAELKSAFHYNDAVLRHLIVRETKAVTEESPIMKKIRLAEEKQRAAEESGGGDAAEVSDAGDASNAGDAGDAGDAAAVGDADNTDDADESAAEAPAK